ncbi:MAG: peptidylprolyl isomerase [Bacteroidales bacterium]|nr:peptidylprolyl isomerase [Bacteroidales bacterium]
MKIFKILLLGMLLWPVTSISQGIPDNENDYLITLNTDYGEIMMVLYDETPIHKMNFVDLARAGVYDHVSFHRVIDHFMIQTGEPETRNKPADYDASIIQKTLPAEIRPNIKNTYGAVGAARRDNPQKSSNGSQFYIIESPKGAPHLDGDYTVFGRVVSGLRVVHKIASVETDKNDRPKKAIRMTVKVSTVKRSQIEKYYSYEY